MKKEPIQKIKNGWEKDIIFAQYLGCEVYGEVHPGNWVKTVLTTRLLAHWGSDYLQMFLILDDIDSGDITDVQAKDVARLAIHLNIENRDIDQSKITRIGEVRLPIIWVEGNPQDYNAVRISINRYGDVNYIAKHLEIEKENSYQYTNWEPSKQSLIQQYYLRNGFGVPVYLDNNHWANGYTPFELGLAVRKKLATPEYMQQFNYDKK